VQQLREAFREPGNFTLGVEEEVMLVDRQTLDLIPQAKPALERVCGDDRFKLELPASQLEIVTPALSSAAEIQEFLTAARADLAAAVSDLGGVMSAGVHPFAAASGPVHRDGRYEGVAQEYGPVAERQLVCALQVHVAVPGERRALAVYNALRSHLPALAALAANAPYHEGVDTGMASVRPSICQQLPRQGVPPAIESFEALAADWAWGARAGTLVRPARWWWELRPHPLHGTLEVRVPDAQTTPEDAAAVAAVVHALVRWLAERHDAGEELAVEPSWRIAENRWSAYRHGLGGQHADLRSGQRTPMREHLSALLETLAPVAAMLNAGPQLEHAQRLAVAGGAERQRAIASERGVRGLAAWLMGRFTGRAGG
jgi:carboxylate-amine ligase